MLGLRACGMDFDTHIGLAECVQVRLYIELDSGFLSFDEYFSICVEQALYSKIRAVKVGR